MIPVDEIAMRPTISFLSGEDKEKIHRAAFQILSEIGLEPERLEMYNLSSAEGARFAEIVTEMSERLAKLDPSPLRPDREATERGIEEIGR